jgi:mono/diheme cytochrome c family protein
MSAPDILPQQQRENPDPHEDGNPAPWPVLALVAVLVLVGMAYIADAGLETPAAWGDGRASDELQGRRATSTTTAAAADGAALYASLCAACHQASGAGLPGVFPPLAGSEWVTGKETTLAAIVLHGINGPLTVKGQTFNGAMPTFKAQLDDAQIAALLTHLRRQWGNTSPAVTADVVAGVRQRLSARNAPFAGGDELTALP